MIKEAKKAMIEKYVALGFGAGDVLFVDTIRVRLTPKTVWRFDKSQFIEQYGSLALLDIGEDHFEPYYDIREVSHE